MNDPVAPDWATLELPNSWPDEQALWHSVRRVFARRRRVSVPANLPGIERLPKYLFQEFHHLPNGNYSKRLTHGYVTGFDRIMLGSMRVARERVAALLQGCRSVLDVGTAGGRMAATLQAYGAHDVWGLDPSPYLLQHAARRFAQVRFVQGVAESLPFPTARFEAIAACFVLHEMPPKRVAQALPEFARVLKPKGLLVICEPSPAQLNMRARELWRTQGWRGLYFRWLAQRVHEPFLRTWHHLDVAQALNAAGFDVLDDLEEFPARFIRARKRSSPNE